MSNSPVLELQNLVSSTDGSITDMLLKAKLIASKLELDGFDDFINKEFLGYKYALFGDDRKKFPSHRRILATIVKRDEYYHHVDIDIYNCEDPLLAKSLLELRWAYVTLSITHLESELSSGGTLYLNIPDWLLWDTPIPVADYQYYFWEIEAVKIKEIISAIKFSLLEWTLSLERQGILGEGLLFTQKEIDAAPMTITHNINNFHAPVNNAGSIGAGNSGDNHQNNSIASGDFDSLKQQFRAFGIQDEDIELFERIIKESPAPLSNDKLGKGIGDWAGAMIGKAYAGELKISGVSAPASLIGSICRYYGIAS
ncbi:abortive phage resistance protein [Klebsiella michiganensis]|uniref:AbiTii domain-containing protein n=1 Tax=Klebsiella michiganensis TaxID=1134687 RepID=UPI001C8BEF36|nr:abortive phage resistance protein [Klebsiella michiganensis]MBX8652242.1 abortive phage resistance protein [Klebsiella michiganensis]